ncbi:unnamed protein product [Heterobilharzia americana]|nr:unnamed protein product [Heterobilharzia americana]
MKYQMKSYAVPNESNLKEAKFIEKKSSHGSTGLKLDLNIDMTNSKSGQNKINCYQCVESNSGHCKKSKSPSKHCSMINLCVNSLTNKRFNSSLDSIRQTIKDHELNDLHNATLISDAEDDDDKDGVDDSEDFVNLPGNNDQKFFTRHSGKRSSQIKRKDFRPRSGRCQSVTGCKDVDNRLTENGLSSQNLDRSQSQNLICSRNKDKLPPKLMYTERKGKLNGGQSEDNASNQMYSDQHRLDNRSSCRRSSLKQKLPLGKVSSLSSNRTHSSLKVRNKSNDRNEYNTTGNRGSSHNIHHSCHYHHQSRLQSPNNQRACIAQPAVRNESNHNGRQNCDRSIHSPISYFLDLDDKPDYHQGYTTCQPTLSPVEIRNNDLPTHRSPLYANNLHKPYHSSNLQYEANLEGSELDNKALHSCRRNLRPVRSKSPCYRQSDISSGSLDRLRKRCHSIEREIGSVEKEKFKHKLNSSSISDPRVDALTTANKILHQRLHDIQKIQENRDHALNKAHAMVNGLLNKQQKQASLIHETTNSFTGSPCTSFTNNHYHHYGGEEEKEEGIYTAKVYKPINEENTSHLPVYTPTKIGHHQKKYSSDYYNYNEREHERRSSSGAAGISNHWINQRKNTDPRTHPTHLLLEKLRSDYADLAHSVYRIEEKARDAASSVQSLLRQFQMGIVDTLDPISVNHISNNHISESFEKVPHPNDLFDKSVTFRLQKARNTLDQLKADPVRPTLNRCRQSDYTLPLTGTTSTVSPTAIGNPMMTSTSASVSGIKSSNLNMHNDDEVYMRYSDQYNRPYTNSLRSTWHVS